MRILRYIGRRCLFIGPQLFGIILVSFLLVKLIPGDPAGEIPSPIDLPTGCYLAGRCPFADDRCRSEMPPVDTIVEGHTVNCFKHRDARRGHNALDYFDDFQLQAEKLLGAGRR